jgi:hypothetical protein
VLSAVDAFVSERLSGGAHHVTVTTGFGPDPAQAQSLAFTAQVRVAF